MHQKIEVLMGVYNGEKYIAAQMESILNQTYKNIHLIIRDNCSEDTTRDIVHQFMQKYPENITLLLLHKMWGSLATLQPC